MLTGKTKIQGGNVKHNSQIETELTLSSGGHLKRFMKVVCMFFANRGAKTSFSAPNWCLDCRTIESIT
jgi:hypothetical protein